MKGGIHQNGDKEALRKHVNYVSVHPQQRDASNWVTKLAGDIRAVFKML